MRVSTAEFLTNYQAVSDQALSEPVTVTENGRDRLVVMSAEEYARLKRRDRRVIGVEELTEEELEAILKAEVSPEYAYLNAELKDGAD